MSGLENLAGLLRLVLRKEGSDACWAVEGSRGGARSVPGVIQCCLHVVSCEKLQVRESSLKLKEDLIVLQTLNISALSPW